MFPCSQPYDEVASRAVGAHGRRMRSAKHTPSSETYDDRHYGRYRRLPVAMRLYLADDGRDHAAGNPDPAAKRNIQHGPSVEWCDGGWKLTARRIEGCYLGTEFWCAERRCN